MKHILILFLSLVTSSFCFSQTEDKYFNNHPGYAGTIEFSDGLKIAYLKPPVKDGVYQLYTWAIPTGINFNSIEECIDILPDEPDCFYKHICLFQLPTGEITEFFTDFIECKKLLKQISNERKQTHNPVSEFNVTYY